MFGVEDNGSLDNKNINMFSQKNNFSKLKWVKSCLVFLIGTKKQQPAFSQAWKPQSSQLYSDAMKYPIP